MPNGMQIAVAGVHAHQARFEAIANDMANINTAGYRRVRTVFQEIATPTSGDGTGGGVRVIDGGRSSAQGNILPSANALSVALQGPGYLQVKLSDGRTGLSRAGDLRLDGTRQLVLPAGERLEPPISIPPGVADTDVVIAADGRVTAAGKKVGQIVVVDVPAPTGLVASESGTLVVSTASGPAIPVTGWTVTQGYLETADFTLADAMVAMIQAQRSFELASKAVSMADQLMRIQNEIKA
jgi:flagellar basal-body rod protein FlgG